MNIKKIIIRNGLWLLTSKIITIFCGIVTTIFIARYLGVNDYGIYTSATVFIGFLITFTDIGMDILFLREGVRENKVINEYFGNSLFIRTILIIIDIIIILIFPRLIGYNEYLIKLIYILSIGLLVTMYKNTCYIEMQIRNKLNVASCLNIIQTLMFTISVLLLITLQLDLYIFAIIQVIVQCSFTLIFIIYSFKLDKPVLRIKKIKYMVSNCYIFGLSSLLYIIYYQIDSLMLSIIKGTTSVGIYQAAYKILDIVIGSLVVVDNAVMPIMYNLYKTNIKEMKKLYKNIFSFMFMIGLPCSVGLFILSDAIINFLYTSKFEPSINVLKILSMVIVFRCLAVASGFVFNAADKMVIKIKFQAVLSIMNFILNILMIPRWGYIGATISTLITEILLFILYYIYIGKNYCYAFNSKFFGKVAVSTVAMGIVVYIMHDKLNVIINIAIGVIVYSIFIVKLVGKEKLISYKNVICK